MDEYVKAFVIYVSSLSLKLITIYPAREAEIALLLTKKGTVSTEYANCINIFSKESAKIFSEKTGINKYVIKLIDSKQLLYRPI